MKLPSIFIMNCSLNRILGSVLFIMVYVMCESYCHAYSQNSQSLVVDSPFGKIKGSKKIHERTGKPYYSFKGIPYAKPPVGELRFTKPQPHPKIDGIFDATKEGSILCPQEGFNASQIPGVSEDCLVLNIQTPSTAHQKNDLKKVLVFIHGGGFYCGTAYGLEAGSFVVSQDVIVVAMNYRLGILGFLSTENEACPGNYGLWDQTLALRWVKENIRAFGGDPDDMTLSGESAGGESIGFHVLYPESKDLFTKAWAASGMATTPFILASKTKSLALEAFKHLGCWYNNDDYKTNINESRKIIKCLQKLPLSKLTSFKAAKGIRYGFSPTIDGNFVIDSPKKLLQNFSYLDSIGFFKRQYLSSLLNSDNELYDIFLKLERKSIFSNVKLSIKEKKKTWQKYMTSSRKYALDSITGGDQTVSDAIQDFYNRRIANNITTVVDIMGDTVFLIPSIDLVVAASKHPSCYGYLLYFDHFPEYMKGTMTRGMLHGFDLIYLFDIDLKNMSEGFYNLGISGNLADFKGEMELKRLYSSVIGDFVRTGNPGRRLNLRCGWPKYDKENGNYLRFNLRPWVTNLLEKDKQDFWYHALPNVRILKQIEYLEL